MKKVLLLIAIPLITLTALVFLAKPVIALPALQATATQTPLPEITYLGEGPQTFTIDPALFFLVKNNDNADFTFVTQPGPTYEAAAGENVWSTNEEPEEDIRLFDEEKSFGNVEAGCVINYVQLEDDEDDRRNAFFINGTQAHMVDQGMVVTGNFTTQSAGELTFFAQDSIGLIVQLCTSQAQGTGTVAPTSGTTTGTVAPTSGTTTGTVVAGTATLTAQAQVQTVTATTAANTTQTVTATIAGTTTGTVTPGLTQTATVAATNTNTPVPTPQQLPVTGGGPGPREIALTTLVLFGSAIFLAGAWWLLWSKYRNEK